MKVFIPLLLLFITIGFGAYSQTKIYASQLTASSHVSDPQRSIDENESSSSIITSSSGALLGIGSYDGYLEVAFPTIVPANQTFYVRIKTEDDILDALLGGSLADLLSGIVGGLAGGKQNFTVNVKNNNTNVRTLSSANASNFSGESAKVVSDAEGNKYLAITPNSPYNRVRITQ